MRNALTVYALTVAQSALSDIHSLAVWYTLVLTMKGTLKVQPVIVHRAARLPNVVLNIALMALMLAEDMVSV